MPKKINEGLEYKDMLGLIKPTVFVDEFKSKVGNDDAYVVLSFYIHNMVAADDLVNWFEGGYEWVIDAERSPGEISPNKYLVFVEIKRRMTLIDQLEEMLEDLGTLDDLTLKDWTVTYKGDEYSWNPSLLKDVLILSPKQYREIYDIHLNEWRISAGIPPKPIYQSNSEDIKNLRTLAHIPQKKSR